MKMKKWIESRERGPYAYGLFLMVIRKCLRQQKVRSQIADMAEGMLSIRLKRVNACRLHTNKRSFSSE